MVACRVATAGTASRHQHGAHPCAQIAGQNTFCRFLCMAIMPRRLICPLYSTSRNTAYKCGSHANLQAARARILFGFCSCAVVVFHFSLHMSTCRPVCVETGARCSQSKSQSESNASFHVQALQASFCGSHFADMFHRSVCCLKVA